ncbi:MAG: MoaD/ThiS family protein [Williamsia herbipolensis]|nr:MoaD/ThiS family protein [Williamsia herbipolensis]
MTGSTRRRVEVRYFAAAEAAAGLHSEVVEIEPSTTLTQLRDRLGHARPGLARVLDRSSFLRDSVVVRDHDAPLAEASLIEVLPPFAGG